MMSLLSLPREIFYLIIDDLSFTDLSHLDQTCKDFYLFFRSDYYLEKQGECFIPLVPYHWSPIGKLAVYKCRKGVLIPESYYFLSNTEILIRSLQRRNLSTFTYFWNELRKRESNNQLIDRSISYPLVIEEALLGNYNTLADDLRNYYIADEEQKEYFFERFARYWYSAFEDGIYKSLIAERVQTNEMISEKQDCFNAVLSRDDDKIMEYFSDQRNIPVLIIGACLSGRKDLLLFIESLIGMIPYSCYLDKLLDDLDLDEVRTWMIRRLKIVYM